MRVCVKPKMKIEEGRGRGDRGKREGGREGERR